MKVKKPSRKGATTPPDVAAVIDRISQSASDDDLLAVLNDIPIWRYPRGDLHSWVPALDRFDDVLAEMVQSYELAKLQTNDFTPKTKELLLNILRVTRLLLENCTSRKIYASYDRLADLLLTTDLDVLHATLLLLLRPAQQYAAQVPIEAPLAATLASRLLTLTRGWEAFHVASYTPVQLASLDIVNPPVAKVEIQYYPEQGSRASITTLELDVSELSSPDLIAETAEKHKIPVDDQLGLLNQARVLAMTKERDTRRLLLSARYLAVATYVLIVSEEASLSTIFLYETSLVPQLAELLVPGRDVGDQVLSAAIYAVDGCCHHRHKVTEILTAVGANVTHGILMSQFRDIVSRLTGDGDPSKAENILFEVLDAMLGFIAFITLTPQQTSHVLGAGIVPVLLKLAQTPVLRRDNYIPRATGLLEALVLHSPSGLTALSNADGLNTLVKCVKAELESLMAQPVPEPTYALSADTIKLSMTTPLKATLRMIHRLMQSSGSAEGMRNLVDSELPNLLKQIYSNSAKCGTRVFSLAINVMATFIHNEPTSLSILQEQQLPQVLFEEIERAYPTSFDVLSVISGVIGAVCLNQTGMDFTLAHPKMLEGLVSAAMASDHHAIQLGQNLDELCRHHPPLRPIVLKAVLGQIQRVCDEGAAFSPPEKDRQRYLFNANDTAGDFDRKIENEALNNLLKMFTVLQGLLRNSTLSKEFIQQGGLTMLLDTADLPCIPIHASHGPSRLYGATLGVFQTVGEHNHAEMASALIESVQKAMEKVSKIWKEGHSWDDLGDRVPVLRGLTVRIGNLTNYYIGLPPYHNHNRNATYLIKALGASSGKPFLRDTGIFHRVTMEAASRLKIQESSDAGAPVDDPKGSAAKYLSSRLYTGFTKMYKAFVRLLLHKRMTDPAHRKEADALSRQISDILIGHCEHSKTLDGSLAVVYDTVALGTAQHQLFDDRGVDGHLNMILFLAFRKRGGITHLLSLVERLVTAMDREDMDESEKTRTTAGVTVASQTISALVGTRATVDNPQTHVLQQRAEEDFKPNELLVKLRRDVFPLAQRVWHSKWLVAADKKLMESGIGAFLTIMDGKDETGGARPFGAERAFRIGGALQAPAAPVVRAPVVAEPARVDQLVDMGFPRGSAERALVRARNNVAAAADMILSMPHVFEIPEPAAPAPANSAVEPAADAAANTPAENATDQPTDNTAAETPAENAAAADPVENVAADQIMDVDPSPDVPEEPIEDVRKALDDSRKAERPSIAQRALTLLDSDESQIHHLLQAFTADEAGLQQVLSSTQGLDEKYLARRLRLFPLLCHNEHVPELSDANASLAFDTIKALPVDTSPRPSWLTSLLVFVESVLVLCINTRNTDIGAEIVRPTTIARFDGADRLIAACQGIFVDAEASKDELISAYRCVVVLSRSDSPIDFSACLAPFKHSLDEKLLHCHGLLAMILRHHIEDRAVLEAAMRLEVRNYLSRDKVTDVKHFAKQLRQFCGRNGDVFVDAVEKECTLVDPAPPAQNYHIRAKETEQTSSSDPFQADAVNPTITLLVQELGASARATLDNEETAEGYTGLIFSLLTEVTGSYLSAKKAFMETLRQHGLYGQHKNKGGIFTIINDLVGCVELGKDLGQEGPKRDPTRRAIISSWGISLLVGLCSNNSVSGDNKSIPEDLITIRRTVLDAIAKILKDTSSHEPNVRYGKLWAIGELVHGLLMSKPSVDPRRHDDSSLQIAKLMVEKGFVSLMTDAMGNVDLNFPNIKVSLLSILRALEYLSKVSIKWSKVEKNKGDRTATGAESVPSSSSDEESDVDMDNEPESDAPDLYRNSALGILGGEMEDESDEDEDEEGDDEDVMEIYGDEIDEDDDLGTEPSSDEDMDDVDEVMDGEDEWTDEDGDEGEDEDDELNDDDIHPVIGVDDDAEPIWDTPEDDEGLDDDDEHGDGPMMDPVMGDMGALHDFLDGMDMEGMEDEEDMDEDDMDGEDMMLLDDDGMAEEDFGDAMDGGMEATFHPPAPSTGAWGWSSNPVRQDRRSRLMDDANPMNALFGGHVRQPVSDMREHPLLVDPARNDRRNRSHGFSAGFSDSFDSLQDRMGPEASRLIETVLLRHRQTGRQDLRIGFNQGPDGSISLQIDGRTHNFASPDQQNVNAEQPPMPIDITADFVPKPTAQRYHDEMYICGEDSAKLVNHIINRLLPEAKVRAAKEAEKQKEDDAKAKKEAEEAEAKAKQEDEAKKAEEAQKAAQSAAAEAAVTATAANVALPESRIDTPSQDIEMADTAAASSAQPEVPLSEPSTSGPATASTAATDAPVEDTSLARTLISIHGRDVDITGTGIDLEFLQALPDDMRADVVEQHMREHNRSRRTERTSDAGATQVSREFLDALPPEIRDEVLLQEQLEAQRRAPPVPPPAGAPPAAAHGVTDMARFREALTAASTNANDAEAQAALGRLFQGRESAEFFASLTAELRDVVGGGPGMPIFDRLQDRYLQGGPPDALEPWHLASGRRRRPIAADRPGVEPPMKKPRRDAVQLLDKPGIASLVRLLFFPDSFKRDALLSVLVNLCENSTTRVDLLNLLLSVVQDGSGDLPAVDKSFSQMSLKPGATPKATPKTPARVPDTPGSSIAQHTHASPLFAKLRPEQIPPFIAQRCFEALTEIVGTNSLAVTYFLTEHEQPVGLRKPPSKKDKGKGKERLLPQTKFPIVILLDFLDRSVLLQTSGMMESFAALLAAITKPLASMKSEEKKKAMVDQGQQTEEPDAVESATATQGDSSAAPPQGALSSVLGPLVRPNATSIPILPGLAAVMPAAASSTRTPAKSAAAEATAASVSASLKSPPHIPAPTLRLVVNCLTMGECTSRTFGYTLSIIRNLSVIPDAKMTILDELHVRAQRLGSVLYDELRELNDTLQDQSTEVDATALIKFSPPSSSQAQLLRLLKTIDYIHTEKVDADPPGETMTDAERAVAQAFDGFDFEPMWKQLSDCLGMVDSRDRIDQIATVLLPLVEALMVICKYRRPEVSRETRSPSAPPNSATEPQPPSDDLFVSFTTTHRKVLNAIVRTNPGLLSGSFSLLVRNPRVLEFDNKRNWFLQKLKRKRDQPASIPVLHLNIRRQYVFEDSFRSLERRTGDEVKYGKLSVKFYNEDGIDAGGVTREWFSVLAQQIFDPNFALFEPCAADAQTYQPNKASSVNGDHLSYFKFVGRVIGKAVFDGRLLDAYFSRAFYKQILGKSVDMRDLESIDPEFHKSLQWMLDNDITDVIDQEFTIEDDQFGEQKVVELKEGGAQIPVTEENKAEYVRLVVSYRIENSIKDQIKAFLNGFYEIIPRKLIQIFEADQLELLISGITSIDVDELKNATQMSGWKGSDPEVGWFWRALRSFSQEDRARFLMFVTSSSRVPLGGFTQLQGASGIQPFQLQKLYSKEGSLPQASTCFNLLLLPKYESYEQLREKLMFAVYETGGFGKA